MENFETQLIDAIQPIRFHALATAIYHLFETGIYDKLSSANYTLESLADSLSLDPAKLAGFMRYLANEGIVDIEENTIILGLKGFQLAKFRGWYTLLIGGYGGVFLSIGDSLKINSGWAQRDDKSVGTGSCLISHFDAIPLTRSLMDDMPKKCTQILDIGCGNALYLIEFCKTTPDVLGWGVEPSRESYQESIRLVKQAKLEDRIIISNVSALEFISSPFHCDPDLVVVGFVLQEILSQNGEQGVLKFLTEITNKFPDIYIAVIEVDNQISNAKIMKHGLSLAYYNPYYLVHYFTNQMLKTADFWEEIFSKSNLEMVSKKTTDAKVDSTELEIGYLLRSK
jgi:2-ketoarginine methyltransferase